MNRSKYTYHETNYFTQRYAKTSELLAVNPYQGP